MDSIKILSLSDGNFVSLKDYWKLYNEWEHMAHMLSNKILEEYAYDEHIIVKVLEQERQNNVMAEIGLDNAKKRIAQLEKIIETIIDCLGKAPTEKDGEDYLILYDFREDLLKKIGELDDERY